MYYIIGYENVLEFINKTIGLRGTSFNYYNEFFIKYSVFDRIPDSDIPLITSYEGALPYCYDHLLTLKDKYTNNSAKINSMIVNNVFYEWFYTLSKYDKIYELINRIIKIVIINKLSSYTNGTTQKTIGLASMDFKDEFDCQDFIELVFHQLTHMVLFIDDIANIHMNEDTKGIHVEVDGVKSVFGNNMFPIYLLFHSYIVGVEILSFRAQLFGLNSSAKYHGSTDRIVRLCKKMSSVIEENINMFSGRSREIFKESLHLLNVFEHYEEIK
ncbi:hypothetical protein [Photorhabdus luminescens]|uniref:hypothetical protein n=1 Tax=Photorhabdus luminescens TaxID=29488 RepID=UPI00223EEE44|nr:hypothetical protein [Photorhabdus luminescens]MCW7762296.1 hypothetical protein [Photorhabdus luminescens subsp. venezuelensis]